jgi:hypothetical protein
MPNYQNGKIYKLVNTEGTLTYIGSTCQSLAQRKAKHHSNYKCWKNGKVHFVSSYKIFDDDEEGCQIVLLEAFPCDSKIELEKRERHYIESNTCINKYRPTRTDKEYYEDNKPKLLQMQKIYREENIKQILERDRLYREKNKNVLNQKKKVKHKCVCGGNYTAANKAGHMKSLKHQKYMNSIKTEQDEIDKLEEDFNNI